MANEIDNLNPPTCDQRPGRGRIKTWHQDKTIENNARGPEGRVELLEENQALLDQRLAAVEAHLIATARTKGAV